MSYAPIAQTELQNRRILTLLSRYLNDCPDYIQPEMMRQLMDCGVDAETAFSLLMAAAMGLDVEDDPDDRALVHAFFPQMIHRLPVSRYRNNPYCKSVHVKPTGLGGCTLETARYAPFEAFVCDDILCLPDGRRIPQIGFFEQPFAYPALFENGRLWMSVTPNEIHTMADPIARASGRVLAFGLGLGYFPFMVAQKPDVVSVTVVEQNPNVIDLFESCMLPQFLHGDKLHIVCGDAFAFAVAHYPQHAFDFMFTDLWHDVSDGLPMYQRMRALSALAPDAVHTYWIEPTLNCYLEDVPLPDR